MTLDQFVEWLDEQRLVKQCKARIEKIEELIAWKYRCEPDVYPYSLIRAWEVEWDRLRRVIVFYEGTL